MFDAYEVAYKLKAVDQFSAVMGALTSRLIAADVQATKLQEKLEGIGKLFKAGVLTTGAGLGMAMTLKAATNEAVRYEQQMNRLKSLNLDNKFGAGATASLSAQAQAIANTTAGTTQREALRLITETQAITGDLKHTAELAPVLAKMRFGMEAYMSAGGKGEGHGAGAEKQFADVVKLMEMRGLMRDFTGEKLERMADLFVKNYAASGGMVKPSDFLAMMKTGGIAGKSVNDDFMFALGHIMQEKGGNRSGTQLMSAYQNMVAGRSTQQVAENMMRMGLLNAAGIHYGKTGHITKTDFDALKGSELMQANPLEYLNTYILPALAKKGIDINNAKAVIPQLAQMASNRTGADFLAQLYLERGQIANYMEQSKNAMGYQALYAQGKGSTVGQQIDLQAKVNQLELEFGTAALPLLKAALEQAIPLVKQMGEWLDKHPDGLKTLVYSIAGLSAAMLVSGPLMVLGSGIKMLGVVMPVLGKTIISMAGSIMTNPWVMGLMAAGAAGYAVGSGVSFILDKIIQIITGGKNVSAGDFAYDATHESVADHDKKLMEQFYRDHPTVRPHSVAKVQGNGDVYLDGKKVGKVIAPHVSNEQARAAVRPTGGTTGYDSRMAPTPVGMR